MRPHPRIPKTIMWGGAAVTVLLVVVWIGSAWIHGRSVLFSNLELGIGHGYFFVEWDSTRMQALEVFDWRMGSSFAGWELITGPTQHGPFRATWLLMPIWKDGSRGWRLYLPVWIPLLVGASPVVAAWRLEALARRRARAAAGFCPKCNYDRAGLGFGVVCPECGAAHSPASL